MTIDELIGHQVALTIRRFGPPGALLAVNDTEELLLIGSEIPEGARVGDELDVFVYLDSEARPIATTRVAKLELGQVAFLEVTELTRFGAFVDWGMAKELLVPFAEQTADVRVGSRHAIGLYMDDSGRLAGTMRVSEMLRSGGDDDVEWKEDEWVEGEAWRYDPEIGLFVIVERSFVGLVPRAEPHSLSRGEAARFRVTNVLPDGKIELSLRGHAHEELAGDAERILAKLSRPNPPKIGDKSSPDDIRDVFGISKKAFKRAVGRLLKERSVVVGPDGTLVVATPRRG
ncbi:MAG: nucleic acid-binding protein [Labilithrix sp.]|nr:nucleic acid-binding protein [Labilithrix sp.]